MSGGVDSSVAAAVLRDAGHEVIGVTLHLWDYPEDPEAEGAHNRCCAPEDQYDARCVADKLGVPHYTFDRRELFAKEVVAPFIESYLAGETPSPCTSCNRSVKLGELFHIARTLGASRVATGHYARVVQRGGKSFIARGVDRIKDQSYFLYAATEEQASQLMFPLGEMQKAEVRAKAVELKLPGATKGESQELCFVGAGAGAYTKFVEERAKARVRPGPILQSDGTVVGEHDGVHRFTVGQRKGIGVALGKPAFVTRIDAKTGSVTLGDEQDLLATTTVVHSVHLAPDVALPIEADVRVRYRHEPRRARITAVEGQRALVRFDEPVRAITRGQVAVFYDGDRVLGGGTVALDAT